MLTSLSILGCLAFATLYPLFFFTQYRDPIRDGFFRFNQSMAAVVGGVGVVMLFAVKVSTFILGLAVPWIILLLASTAYAWRRDDANEWLLAGPSLLGIPTLFMAQVELAGTDFLAHFIGLLGGLIFCGVFFAMIAGHWYLNVRKMPIRHLNRTVRTLGVLLLLRTIWDLTWMSTGRIEHQGYTKTLWAFSATSDGIFVLVALMIGTILPLVTVWFVLRTTQLRATESATGLLYVMVLMIFMGELAYKYYLYTFGLIL